MIKTIPPRSWPELSDRDQLVAVKYGSAGLRGTDFSEFVKAASHPLAQWVRDNPPKPGEQYVHSVALGSTEKYGCFFAGAPVQTETGLRPIEDVGTGDLVLTHKNRYRRVTHTFAAPYTGTRLHIKCSGLPVPIVTTPEHPVWVVRRKDFGAGRDVDTAVAGGADFVRADGIAAGDYLVVPTAPEWADASRPAPPYVPAVIPGERSTAVFGARYALAPVESVATDEVADSTRYNLEVEEDNSYVVMAAVHNCNRNGDGYSDEMLRRDHPTFEKYARFYYNHLNKDPAKSYGVVKRALYNEPLGRVEVITALNATKEAADRNGGLVAERTLNKMASGLDVAVSQSCSVPYDVCSSCGHKARNRTEYCTGTTCKYGGCRDNLGRAFDDGFHLYVDNPHCRFFDLSDVSDTRGADRTAFVTGKVATGGRVIGGAELAEMMGLVPPDYLIDPAVRATTDLVRKLARDRRTVPVAAVPDWDTVVAVRAKLAGVSAEAPTFSGSDFERHAAVAALGLRGVVLPPDIWLSAVTGVDREKCAAAFAGGMDPDRHLLDRTDCCDLLAEYAITGAADARPHWLAPSPRALAREAQLAALGAVKAAAHGACPPAVAAEAKARYLAYQSGILSAHKNSGNLPLIWTECLRHNS